MRIASFFNPAGTIADERPGVMVITRDDGFYYSLFSVSLEIGWSIHRARSVERAWEGLHSQPVPVVVYDERLPCDDWREGLRSCGAFPGHPVILLAASEVNEDLWRTVLHCHGYDAVRRSANWNEWARMLRFAWHSGLHGAGKTEPAAALPA
jgi:hypothetical protein